MSSAWLLVCAATATRSPAPTRLDSTSISVYVLPDPGGAFTTARRPPPVKCSTRSARSCSYSLSMSAVSHAVAFLDLARRRRRGGRWRRRRSLISTGDGCLPVGEPGARAVLRLPDAAAASLGELAASEMTKAHLLADPGSVDGLGLRSREISLRLAARPLEFDRSRVRVDAGSR